ncbi:MAG: hypothetical protein ACOX6U_08920 [Oscillospiraceae bacterium]
MKVIEHSIADCGKLTKKGAGKNHGMGSLGVQSGGLSSAKQNNRTANH